MAIRRLAPRDADAFRALRLEALRVVPSAFGRAFEEEAGKPLSWFGETLERCAIFAAADAAGGFCGMLGYQRDSMLKRAHIGHLWGMYVRHAARRQGLGAALIGAAIAHARSEVSVLQIMVGEGNSAARRLYERAGFTLYGTELASLRVEGVETVTLLMAMTLD
ncbi:GNAT family N-acetyltransferase [Roseococcus sp. SDR]|uniref:GNAT family N-acetyltransferase n=1 Tax=Roseococcus sp. SDR TaxID=2835532 RepID=UPI001BCD04C0|nr:GNAT family N-acetyltransferase [Roseococcus sp. SDR]MBS7788504.1 GNAT family N-acetyltransferase [Roseococcus sp. SDR]MBV1843818.1 GNAT family N-acetyltransferase [Roseococcus sp. SDR]